MKNSHKCPKCESREIRLFVGEDQAYGIGYNEETDRVVLIQRLDA